MTGRCAVTDDAELTGVPLFEIRTDVASAGVRICVVGGDAGMAEDARARLIELAGRWSATGADSEIKRINDSGGTPVSASAETVLLVGLALQAARETRGAYDPRASRGPIDPMPMPRRPSGATPAPPGRKGSPSIPVSGPSPYRRTRLSIFARSTAALRPISWWPTCSMPAPTESVWTSAGMFAPPVPRRRAPAGSCASTTPPPRGRSATCGCARAPSARVRAPPPDRGAAGNRAGVVAVTVVAATAWQAATIAQAAMRAGCPRGRHPGRARRRRGVVLLRRRDAPVHRALAGLRGLTAPASAPRRHDGGQRSASPLAGPSSSGWREHGDARRRCLRTVPVRSMAPGPNFVASSDHSPRGRPGGPAPFLRRFRWPGFLAPSRFPCPRASPGLLRFLAPGFFSRGFLTSVCCGSTCHPAPRRDGPGCGQRRDRSACASHSRWVAS